jgi:hypothetical protein
MKRNQKKYTKKNYKGGVVDSNMAKISLAALKKRLEDIELNIDTIKTKMGEVNPVEGPSREDNTGYGEAGFPEEKPVVEQNNPNIQDFVRNPSTSEKFYNGTTPITQNQYDEVDRLNIQIKGLMGDRKNKKKLGEQTSLKNAILKKYKKRVDYLEKEQKVRNLSPEEQGEYDNLVANLNDPILGGRRKSRRYRKSRKGKRTRKYKK